MNNIEHEKKAIIKKFWDIFVRLENQPIENCKAQRASGCNWEEDSYNEIIIGNICIGMNTSTDQFFIQKDGKTVSSSQEDIYKILNQILPEVEKN